MTLRFTPPLLALILVATAIPILPPAAAQEPIHPAIHIDGDADLLAQATANGWPGSGAPGDPIVIEGLHFEETSGRAISIKNATLSVEVRACTFVIGKDQAIRVENASAFVARGNKIVLVDPTNWTMRTTGEEIFVKNAAGARIVENTFGEKARAIQVVGSDDVHVVRNTAVRGNALASFSTSDRAVVTDNLVSLTPMHTISAIALRDSADALIARNHISGARGIAFEGHASGVARENVLDVPGQRAFHIHPAATSSGAITIEGNAIRAAGIGVHVWGAKSLLVRDNDIGGLDAGGIGVHVQHNGGPGVVVEANRIAAAGATGVHATWCYGCVVRDNDIVGDGRDGGAVGIQIVERNARVSDNRLANLGVGVSLKDAEGGAIVTDSALTNVGIALHVRDGGGDQLLRNVVAGADAALLVENSSRTVVDGLQAASIAGVALRIYHSDDVRLQNMHVHGAAGVAHVEAGLRASLHGVVGRNVTDDGITLARTSEAAVSADLQVGGTALRLLRTTYTYASGTLSGVVGGALIDGGRANRLVGLTAVAAVPGEGTGVRFFGSTAPFVRDSIIGNWSVGVHVDGGAGMVGSNRVEGNDVGIFADDAHGLLVYDNVFDNDRNARVVGGSDHEWTAFQQDRRNILGGRTIAGNWWSDYIGADADGDGLGDVPYGTGPWHRAEWAHASRLLAAQDHVEWAPFDRAPLVAR